MKKVFIAQHPTEAHFVAGLLASYGIAAEVRGEALFGTRGEVPVTASTLPSVWVIDDSQADQALRVLHDRPAAGPADIKPAEPWTCSRCGESVEGQFAACWNCGAEAPGTSGGEAS